MLKILIFIHYFSCQEILYNSIFLVQTTIFHYLCVTAESLARRGRHHKATVRVCLYDCGNSAKMLRIRQRRAAKFYNLNSHTHQILSLLLPRARDKIESEIKNMLILIII